MDWVSDLAPTDARMSSSATTAAQLKRHVLIFLFATCTVLGCDHAIWGPFGTHHGRVTVVNGSRKVIIKGDLVICGQRFTFDNLRSNEFKEFSYRIGSCPGQDYRVAVTFESGGTITRKVGYVTSGFDFSHELIIRQEDVVLGSTLVGDRLGNLSDNATH